MFAASKKYPNDALEPYISSETQNFHFEKHHKGYAKTLENLIEGTQLEDLTIFEIMSLKDRVQDGLFDNLPQIFNNAYQFFNHDFYWNSLSKDGGKPSEKLSNAINECYGDLENFKQSYIDYASKLFGSGWSWFVYDDFENKIGFFNASNADNPLIYSKTPLLVVDLWEHAYYIDYRNDRKKYLENVIMHCLNWNFANSNFKDSV